VDAIACAHMGRIQLEAMNSRMEPWLRRSRNQFHPTAVS
jgi:hypothetical protein